MIRNHIIRKIIDQVSDLKYIIIALRVVINPDNIDDIRAFVAIEEEDGQHIMLIFYTKGEYLNFYQISAYGAGEQQASECIKEATAFKVDFSKAA